VTHHPTSGGKGGSFFPHGEGRERDKVKKSNLGTKEEEGIICRADKIPETEALMRGSPQTGGKTAPAPPKKKGGHRGVGISLSKEGEKALLKQKQKRKSEEGERKRGKGILNERMYVIHYPERKVRGEKRCRGRRKRGGRDLLKDGGKKIQKEGGLPAIEWMIEGTFPGGPKKGTSPLRECLVDRGDEMRTVRKLRRAGKKV